MYALPMFHGIPPDVLMPFSGFASKPGFTQAEIGSVEFSLGDEWGSTTYQTEYGSGFSELEVRDLDEIEATAEHVRIEGKVANTGDAPADDVRVLLLVYDQQGRFVGDEQSYVGSSAEITRHGNKVRWRFHPSFSDVSKTRVISAYFVNDHMLGISAILHSGG